MVKRTTVSAVILLSLISLMPLMSLAASEGDATDSTATSSAKNELLWHEAEVLLPTRVVFPPEFDAKRPHTLIVALHGIGGTAEEFQGIAEAFAAAGFVVAVPEAAYPILEQGKLGYDWTLIRSGDFELLKRSTVLASSDQLPVVVTDLKQRYRVDSVYILGFSQGALLAIVTGLYNSALFDGVVSFATPAFDTSWFTGNTLVASNGVRVLLVHGQEDPHARFAVSEHARDALKDAGYDVTFRPFAGGHTVPNDQLDFVAKWIREVNP
jgi:phospholipase/carboxylesterase